MAKLDLDKISDPIELTDGIAILKVTQKDLPTTTSLETAKPRIRTILQDQKARELAGTSAWPSWRRTPARPRAWRPRPRPPTSRSCRPACSRAAKPWATSIRPARSRPPCSGSRTRRSRPPSPTYGGVALAELRKIEAPRPATFEEVQSQVATDLADAREERPGPGQDQGNPGQAERQELGRRGRGRTSSKSRPWPSTRRSST